MEDAGKHQGRGLRGELLTRPRGAPTAPLTLPPDTLAALIAAQVQVRRGLQQAITKAKLVHPRRVHANPRAQFARRAAGVGSINPGQLLAEVGLILGRVDTAEQAAV